MCMPFLSQLIQSFYAVTPIHNGYTAITDILTQRRVVLKSNCTIIPMNTCRICGERPDLIHDFGDLRNTSIFPGKGEECNIPQYPVCLYVCTGCGLVQLEDEAPPDVMYRNGGYGYKSGVSNTMREHLRKYNLEARALCPVYPGDTVLDIGSNDATFLSYYPKDVRCLGVDPAGEQFRDCYTRDMSLLADYFTLDNFRLQFGNVKCKLVTSVCMFYDLPDPVAFARDINQILHDDGIWTCEQSYLFTMMDTFSLDTVCHEHLEYYGLTPIMHICKKVGLKIVDIRFNDSNGGSFRLYFAKETSDRYEECTQLIGTILHKECVRGIKVPQIYKDWVGQCFEQLGQFNTLLDEINASGKTVGLYGASTKGNFVLQVCNVTPDRVKYAVERNPKKYGKCTNTGVPIISEEEMRSHPPDYLVVLPWHFFTEIRQREQAYLDGGGQMICYFPKMSIVRTGTVTLVTGATGFIASYLIPYLLDQGHLIYGTSRSNNIDDRIPGVTYMQADMNQQDQVDRVIRTVRPDWIIHLAGISSSIHAVEDPMQTFKTTLWTGYLAEAMRKYVPRSKLFITSSSELYKGHGRYTVDDADIAVVQDTCPPDNHPYSIAKLQAEQIADYYRSIHNVWISTGILFTVQSARKSECFLLNKVVRHIWEIKNRMSDIPLQLGYLDARRSMIHPDDVASAINIIMEQREPDTYVISGTESVRVRDLVEQLYRDAGIDMTREDPEDPYSPYVGKWHSAQGTYIAFDKVSDRALGLDTTVIDIRGIPSKLHTLGWTAMYTVADIMSELLEATGSNIVRGNGT